MPTYRYECRACHATHEYFQSMSEKPKRKCPTCGGKLDRLIGTGAGILLKGSGFHNTDYRSSAYHEAAKSDASSASPPTPTSDSSAGKKESTSSPSPSSSSGAGKSDSGGGSSSKGKSGASKKKAKES